jgi:N-acetylglucosamine-6-phosphate deacetylase
VSGHRFTPACSTACRPLHRRPDAGGVLLDRDEVTFEVTIGSRHLCGTTIRLVAKAAGPDRLVVVTDAVATAGMPQPLTRYFLLAITYTHHYAIERRSAVSGRHFPAGRRRAQHAVDHLIG